MIRFAIAVLSAAIVCCSAPRPSGEDQPLYQGFVDPQPVTIRGYEGDAMEPFITRDGAYLLFNNSNDPSVNTDLHYASRVDDRTFEYRGPIEGANTSALDGVASVDLEQAFYFISTRAISGPSSTIFRGTFSRGRVDNVSSVGELLAPTPGMLCFDAEVSASGTELYIACGRFSGGPVPRSADLILTERTGPPGLFRRSSSSDRILQNVNTDALEYAPSISTNGRELYFTRVTGRTAAIYLSTRSGNDSAFELPRRVAAADGFVEGPSLSFDGRVLYFHRRTDRGFRIQRATRGN